MVKVVCFWLPSWGKITHNWLICYIVYNFVIMFRVNHRAEYDDVDGDDLKKPLVYGKKNQITLYFLTNV